MPLLSNLNYIYLEDIRFFLLFIYPFYTVVFFKLHLPIVALYL